MFKKVFQLISYVEKQLPKHVKVVAGVVFSKAFFSHRKEYAGTYNNV